MKLSGTALRSRRSRKRNSSLSVGDSGTSTSAAPFSGRKRPRAGSHGAEPSNAAAVDVQSAETATNDMTEKLVPYYSSTSKMVNYLPNLTVLIL